MLEIIRTTEGTNDGEIWNKETEFVLDGITGNDLYIYNWYEPLEYQWEVLKWGNVVIDRNVNGDEYKIKGAELLTQSQIDELSTEFGWQLKEVIESGNYTKF